MEQNRLASILLKPGGSKGKQKYRVIEVGSLCGPALEKFDTLEDDDKTGEQENILEEQDAQLEFWTDLTALNYSFSALLTSVDSIGLAWGGVLFGGRVWVVALLSDGGRFAPGLGRFAFGWVAFGAAFIQTTCKKWVAGKCP